MKIEARGLTPSTDAPMHRITTQEQLDALYGTSLEAAVVKEIDYIHDHYRAFIDKAPFVVVATVGPEGLDCSPRGDPPGFVRVRGARTVLIPDRRGNNRVDTLRNLVRDPRISLLFMIPGIGNTLRINGRAEISTEPELCASFAMRGKAPKTVLVVTAERGLCPLSQGPGALAAMERGRAGRPLRAAEHGRDSPGSDQGRYRWHRLRCGLSQAT
jgi:uncharacterized protein